MEHSQRRWSQHRRCTGCSQAARERRKRCSTGHRRSIDVDRSWTATCSLSVHVDSAILRAAYALQMLRQAALHDCYFCKPAVSEVLEAVQEASALRLLFSVSSRRVTANASIAEDRLLQSVRKTRRSAPSPL